MVRLIQFLCLMVCFSSCVRINEFGYSRVDESKFNVSHNKDISVYKIIDTNSIYKLVIKEYKNATGSIGKEYYKFFSKGKIGHYYGHEINFIKDSVFESRKGEMGYYNYYGDKNIIAEFYYSTWHGNRIQTDTLIIQNDTIISIARNLKLNSEIKSIFVREPIPKMVKVMKLDW